MGSYELSERSRRILTTLVREYIETGEPVSSRTLARQSGLGVSSATIRNVLAQLEGLSPTDLVDIASVAQSLGLGTSEHLDVNGPLLVPGLGAQGGTLDDVSRIFGGAARNVDTSQINCTFYDALGADDLKYLLARAIQFFIPGVPQVYYVGLLAGRNDKSTVR